MLFSQKRSSEIEMSTTEVVIDSKNLGFSYKQKVIFENLSFSVDRGEFVSILGLSGIGKSTLLSLAWGKNRASIGKIELKGNFSVLQQQPALLEWLTVYQNVEVPLSILGETNSREKVLSSLQLVGLEDDKDSYPHQISGGMKARVALARAIVTKPDLLILDEPFASLDEITRNDLNAKLSELCQLKKISALMVTHSVSEAIHLSEKILVLSRKTLGGTEATMLTKPEFDSNVILGLIKEVL